MDMYLSQQGKWHKSCQPNVTRRPFEHQLNLQKVEDRGWLLGRIDEALKIIMPAQNPNAALLVTTGHCVQVQAVESP